MNQIEEYWKKSEYVMKDRQNLKALIDHMVHINGNYALKSIFENEFIIEKS